MAQCGVSGVAARQAGERAGGRWRRLKVTGTCLKTVVHTHSGAGVGWGGGADKEVSTC